ncbi:hypothetical protein [Accumulibacter sp.]|uniref:hypothetical protein n=1 Tax=Accumulibacter sp. TaxID=2053492 RepID=UPI0025E34B76|nr:hypothetical protein [Accumulibacter sp.]MCM8594996.1 hypothetical protein [Accumulibacter sp.]MDS4049142.1 hypothetical protein [Accumulibacter sp.]
MNPSTALCVGLLFVSPLLLAQTPPDKLGDVKAQGGQQLSLDELRALLPGAKVFSFTRAGSTRSWSNDPDGAFVASSDSRGKMQRPSRGHGTWHIGDNATYCVTIEWSSTTEQWCRYLFRLGDRYYGTKSAVDLSSEAHALEISR